MKGGKWKGIEENAAPFPSYSTQTDLLESAEYVCTDGAQNGVAVDTEEKSFSLLFFSSYF